MSTILVLSGLQDKGALQAHASKHYNDMYTSFRKFIGVLSWVLPVHQHGS